MYGTLSEYASGYYRFWIYPLGADRAFPVEPDSISQLSLVEDGEEYYEGDIITRNGKKCRVSLEPKFTEVTNGY